MIAIIIIHITDTADGKDSGIIQFPINFVTALTAINYGCINNGSKGHEHHYVQYNGNDRCQAYKSLPSLVVQQKYTSFWHSYEHFQIHIWSQSSTESTVIFGVYHVLLSTDKENVWK